MEQKNVSKEEAKKEFLNVISELGQLDEMENIVKDNKIPFECDEKHYRLRKPNFKEKLELEKFRRKTYTELIKDDTMLFRKQWIAKYKERGIDIDKMEADIEKIQYEMEKMMIRLATMENKENIEVLKKKVLEMKDQQAILNIEKTDLMSYSIEDNILVAINSYYTYLVLEQEIIAVDKEENKAKNKYVRVFDTFEEFQTSEEELLINKSLALANYLIYR